MTPGKSIIVRSGQDEDFIVKMIGSLTIFLVFPAFLSVNSLIFSRTISKSVNFSFFNSSKTAEAGTG